MKKISFKSYIRHTPLFQTILKNEWNDLLLKYKLNRTKKNTYWTEEEKQYLGENYKNIPVKQLAEHLKKNTNSVKSFIYLHFPGYSHNKKYQRTKEECFNIGLNFKTRKEWSKLNNATYSYTLRKGWLDFCCTHMDSNRLSKISDVDCLNSSLKFKTLVEWQTTEPRIVSRARKNKILYKQCIAHLEKQCNKKWTEEEKQYIVDNYNCTNEELSKYFGRTIQSIRHIKRKILLEKQKTI